MFNDEFYPTPSDLVQKMFDKVDWRDVKSVLDPSAGRGDILEKVFARGGYSNYCGSRYDILAIELDPNLQHILLGKGYSLVDSDFLDYAGGDHVDLILMNPPFSNGEHHLLKAIDVLFAGQIVCILNAETIRNPYSNTRLDLLAKLYNLGASVEFISGAFADAERKTNVDVALIYIKKECTVEKDVFEGATDAAEDYEFTGFESDGSVAVKDDVAAIVARYEDTKRVGIQTILDYYKNYKKIGRYISIGDDNETSLTKRVGKRINGFVIALRKSYWLDLMEVPTITGKLTSEKRKEYRAMLEQHATMEFTVRNIRALVANLSASYVDTITDSIVKLFDYMTKQYSYYPEMNSNILHFNGWKTNDAYKVNSKVILPWVKCFDAWSGGLSIPYDSRDKLNDIDRVMNYFDGGNVEYVGIVAALEAAFKTKKTRGVESTYFEISVFKKGTMHIKFKSEDILRRFNLFVCKNKAWLPFDYGTKAYTDMAPDARAVVDSFEGKSMYTVIESKNDFLRLAA